MKKRKMDQLEYIELWKKRKTLGEENMAIQDQEIIFKIQEERPYEDLLKWRILGNAAFELEKQKKELEKKSSSWLPTWIF